MAIQGILDKREKEIIEAGFLKGKNAREIEEMLIDEGYNVWENKFKAIKNKINNLKRKYADELPTKEVVEEIEEVEEEVVEEEEEIVCYEMVEQILRANYFSDSQKVTMLKGFFNIEEE